MTPIMRSNGLHSRSYKPCICLSERTSATTPYQPHPRSRLHGFRDRPSGLFQLKVPVSAVRLVLPRIVPACLTASPDIRLGIIAEDSVVDVLAAGYDAGIRCDERLEVDTTAVPSEPRIQQLTPTAESFDPCLHACCA